MMLAPSRAIKFSICVSVNRTASIFYPLSAAPDTGSIASTLGIKSELLRLSVGKVTQQLEQVIRFHVPLLLWL